METWAEEMTTQMLVTMLVMVLVTMWIIILHDSLQVCSISRTRYSILKDMAMLAKAHYKVAKLPSHHGVSVQQLQTNYKAPNFLTVLKVFLNSHATRDKVVLPVESDLTWSRVMPVLMQPLLPPSYLR